MKLQESIVPILKIQITGVPILANVTIKKTKHLINHNFVIVFFFVFCFVNDCLLIKLQRETVKIYSYIS